MRVAVVGYATDGRASADYFADRGDHVEIRDGNPSTVVDDRFDQRLGQDHLVDLGDFDLVVRSSGIHPGPLLAANPAVGDLAARITTGVNEFVVRSPSDRLIGVTGTKGKGTTSTLITELLRAAGQTAHLGGNIGIGMLSLLPEVAPEDYCVLELSSFQLYDFTARVPTAVVLSVTPEHLNWHADLADYHDSKARLFTNQQPGDLAIFNARSATATAIAGRSPGRTVGFDVPDVGSTPSAVEAAHVRGDELYYATTMIMPIDRIALPGRHNLENVCAAVTATWPVIENRLDAAREVLSSWSGLKDHLELVRQLEGVRWFNDTYATAPDAALAAMRAFTEPKVMIIGGIDKQVPQADFVDQIVADDTVRGVVLIDDLAEQLARLFAERGDRRHRLGGGSMTDIVAAARELTEPGDVVLLSPGAAGNGGMFLDKWDRGRQFNAAVAAL